MNSNREDVYNGIVQSTRIIARLDIKNKNLIKGVKFEGLRILGEAAEFAQYYYNEGADEVILIDSVATLYGRSHMEDVLRSIVENVFIPITAGGGIREIGEVAKLLRSGADKVAINTAAVLRPELITEVAEKFGSQAMVLSVEAKKISPGKWEVYIENGREKTGLDVMDWVWKGIELGAGEVLVTSVDQDGTREGFDIELCRAISSLANAPVIASGGMGYLKHVKEVVEDGNADAVAIGTALHYREFSIASIKEYAIQNQIKVRKS
jgi:cyclase